jgi:hypothetical protein
LVILVVDFVLGVVSRKDTAALSAFKALNLFELVKIARLNYPHKSPHVKSDFYKQAAMTFTRIILLLKLLAHTFRVCCFLESAGAVAVVGFDCG